MIATRPECGAPEGVRWHTVKDEPMCDLCTDFILDRRLAAELAKTPATPRLPTTRAQDRDLRQLIHVLAAALDEHDTEVRPTFAARKPAASKPKPKRTPRMAATPERQLVAPADYRICTRCGIKYLIRHAKGSVMCRDCRDVEQGAA